MSSLHVGCERQRPLVVQHFSAILFALQLVQGCFAIETHRQQKTKVVGGLGRTEDLLAEPFFRLDWASSSKLESAGTARVIAENPQGFSGESGGDFNPMIERPEWELVRKWVPANASVLEIGGRYGTTTCEIAKQLRNSGRIVTVEPDAKAWPDLEHNIKANNCRARVLKGVVNAKPIHLTHSGYAGRTWAANSGDKAECKKDCANVAVFRLDQVEEASGLKFDTLLIDCEGCAQDMMEELKPKLTDQIKLILVEADFPTTEKRLIHPMDYLKFFDLLGQHGFEKVDQFNDCDKQRTGAEQAEWCAETIDHYAFRRT